MVLKKPENRVPVLLVARALCTVLTLHVNASPQQQAMFSKKLELQLYGFSKKKGCCRFSCDCDETCTQGSTEKKRRVSECLLFQVQFCPRVSGHFRGKHSFAILTLKHACNTFAWLRGGQKHDQSHAEHLQCVPMDVLL